MVVSVFLPWPSQCHRCSEVVQSLGQLALFVHRVLNLVLLSFVKSKVHTWVVVHAHSVGTAGFPVYQTCSSDPGSSLLALVVHIVLVDAVG